MGKLVKLEPTAAAQSAAKRRARALAARGVGRPGSIERRGRPRRDKTALVLGGGGFTGGVYEIGALRALDLLTVNSSVSQFDVYVGTSAGAFIASLCANGVSPKEMMSVVTRQGQQPFQLYITANDLDTCERVVFGVDGSEVPISTAVRASGALPMVYAPVRVEDRELIDGGIVSTTNLDIAIQAGAKLVVVINPIVPFVNDFSSTVRTLGGTRPRRVSDMGFPQIGYQVFKLVAHQRLHQLAKGWERRYPGVDIVLIEPEPNDELMFQTSMMNFASRVEIAKHGFESVTKHLAGEYTRYQE